MHSNAESLKAYKIMSDGTIISKLSNRSLISVRGPDSTKLLQNLTTCDMSYFHEDHPFLAA